MSYISPTSLLRFDDLQVGMQAHYTRLVSDHDISLFAQVSGDDNPVHLDEEYAAGTMFKGRIAHGMLSASFISTAIATRLPGPGSIYLSQNLRFKAPVRIGDEVTAEITIGDIQSAKRRVMLTTVCRVGDTVVIEGDATVMVP